MRDHESKREFEPTTESETVGEFPVDVPTSYAD